MNIVIGLKRVSRAVGELEAFLDQAHGGGEKILEQACLSRPPLCPSCPDAKAYRLGGGRFGCSRCEDAFELFAGRWLGRHKLSAQQWLMALKGFELGLDERSMGAWAGITPATAHRVFQTIRLALVARGMEGVPPQLPAPGTRPFRFSRRGVSQRLLPLYLKEAEIRRRMAGRSMFLLLLDAVARYVPADLPFSEDSQSMADCRAKA